MYIGANIKRVRNSKNITRKELAERLGTSYQNISQYERGERHPKIETLKKIAAALDVPVSELLPETMSAPLVANLFSGVDEFKAELASKWLKDDEIILLSSFNSLNSLGKSEAIKRVGELTEIKKYTALDK